MAGYGRIVAEFILTASMKTVTTRSKTLTNGWFTTILMIFPILRIFPGQKAIFGVY